VLASNTTIYDTINYLDVPLNDWLQTHQYDQYKDLVPLLSWYATNNPTSGSMATLLNIIYAGFPGDYAGSALPSNYIGAIASAADSLQFTVGDFTPIVFDASHQHIISHDQTSYETDWYADVLNSNSATLGLRGNFDSVTAYLNNILNNPIINTSSKPTGGVFIDTIYYPPVVLYFYNYDQPTLIQIYQNNVLISDSSSAVVLTTADKNLLTGPGGNQWFNDYPQYFLKDLIQTGGGFVTYAGKITFNYNPANGSDFTVKVTSPGSIRWRYVIAYPVDGQSQGCVPPTTYFNQPPTWTAQYENVSLLLWCGNGSAFDTGSVSILAGYTETWSPVAVPTPTTSIIPFDIAADWYGIL